MKHLQRFSLLLCILGLTIASVAQEKKPLTFNDILKWNRITEKALSADGDMVAYKLEPWKGDPVLKVKEKDGNRFMFMKSLPKMNST